MKNKIRLKSLQKLAAYSAVGLASFCVAAGLTYVTNFNTQSSPVSAEAISFGGSTLAQGYLTSDDGHQYRDYVDGTKLGGNYVFCLEPTIGNAASDYELSGGDAIAGGYSLRYGTRGGSSYTPNDDDLWGLAVAYVVSYMPNNKATEIFGDEVGAFNSYVSGLSGPAWFFPTQLGIWKNLRQITSIPSSLTLYSGNQSDIDAVNAVLANGFASKWDSATSKIIEVLKAGKYITKDGKEGTLSYGGGAKIWRASGDNQLMYEIHDLSLDGTPHEKKQKPKGVKVRKKLDPSLEVFKNLKQFTLKGAVYELLKDGSPVQSSTTDEDGWAKFTIPAPSSSTVGSYSIREKSAPVPENTGMKVLKIDRNDYFLGTIDEERHYDSQGRYSYSTYNSSLPSEKEIESIEREILRTARIRVTKSGDIRDTSFGAGLADAVFTVTFKETGTENIVASLAYKTDASGQIDLSNKGAVVSGLTDIASKMIDEGFVHVTAKIAEVTPPPGHIIDDASARDLPINFNGSETQITATGSASFSNSANFFTLTKYQRNNSLLGGGMIDGAEFTLSGTGGSKTAEVQGGHITFYNVTPGAYTLTETRPAPGYQKNDNSMTVSVGGSGGIGFSSNTFDYDIKDVPYIGVNGSGKNSFNVLVENTPRTANFDLKKINEKNRALRGAKFALTQISSPVDKSNISDSARGSNAQPSFNQSAKNVKTYYMFKKTKVSQEGQPERFEYRFFDRQESDELGVRFVGVDKGEYKVFEGFPRDPESNDNVYLSFKINKQGVITEKRINDDNKQVNTRATTQYVADDPATTDKNEEKEAISLVSVTNKLGLSSDLGIATDANGSINFTPKLVNADGEDGLVIGAEYMLEETEAPQGYKLPRTRKRFYFTVNTNPNNDQYQINYRFDTNDKTSNSNEEWVRGEEKVVRLGETATFSTPSQSRELISAPEEIDTITMSLDQATKKLSINYQAMNMTRDKLPATGSAIMMIALGIGMTGLGAAAVYQLKRVKS